METVLRDFFGTDRMTLTVTNPDEKITRTFASFSEIAKSAMLFCLSSGIERSMPRQACHFAIGRM
jgi:hypothetical protein